MGGVGMLSISDTSFTKEPFNRQVGCELVAFSYADLLCHHFAVSRVPREGATPAVPLCAFIGTAFTYSF
jgi:hypothetical protein